MRKAPKLPEESYELIIPDDNGEDEIVELVVKGLLLSQSVAISDASVDNTNRFSALLLESSVFEKATGEQLYDAAGWDAYGALNPGAYGDIFQIAMRVSGLNRDELEKN